ncbi:MAG TPA: FkbM family methyltransferase [Candidatus Angelobacter sp.]|nr:FkbM family methyltransferase [Candidatus Angelobacter sp.]
MRPGRITKYTGRWKGHNTLLRLYRKYLPANLKFRVSDFDGDLKFDVNMRGNLDICMWHFPKLYEKEQREVFCSLITPGCTVLDVGANIGLYTLLAAKRGARVFSVEADPCNAALLRHHVEINGFSEQVTIFEMAATEHACEVSLFRHAYNPGESNIIENGHLACKIAGDALDALDLPPIDLCKMDIEGAELMALKGMERTIRRSPQMKLLVEYAQHLGAGEYLLEHLKANFASIQAIEQNETCLPGKIPEFCNLLAQK